MPGKGMPVVQVSRMGRGVLLVSDRLSRGQREGLLE